MKSRIWYKEGLLQITLESPGCRYAISGEGCRMCMYGNGEKISANTAAAVMARGFYLYPDPRRVLVGSFGSVFDEAEVSREVLETVCDYLALVDVEEIYFETHARTVEPGVLAMISERLGGRTITVEMGLEVADQDRLDREVGKNLSLTELADAIKRLHLSGMRAAVNVLYGMWDIAAGEVDADFRKTCEWAVRNLADEIVVFPINVKAGTELRLMYDKGMYRPPTHEELIGAVGGLSDETLTKIYFAWTGDRQTAGVSDAVPPGLMRLKNEEVQKFYNEFTEEETASGRRKLIREVLKN